MESIILIGADSQVGTTMIAQSLAESMGKEQKILLVMASGKTGDDFFENREERSIDDIKANLLNEQIDRRELGQVLLKEGDIHILPGVRDALSSQYYTENSMKPLQRAASGFDRMIIDAGDDIRSGLFISSLLLGGRVFLVMTQQEKSLRRFRYMKNKVLEPLRVTPEVILNKYQNSLSLVSSSDAAKVMGLPWAARIPYSEYGWQAEMERRTLMGEKKFRESILSLKDHINGVKKELWIKSLIRRST